MRFLKKVFYNLICVLIRSFSFLIPKDENLWIFGAWNGETYTDNPKILFEYCRKYHPGKRYVWVTQNDDVVSELSAEGADVVKARTLKWLYCILRASVLFVSAGGGDIGGILPGRCTAIQLWHGYGGKVWKKKASKRFFRDSNVHRLLYGDRNSFYWMAPSEYSVETVHGNHGVNYDRCYITGQPRDDILKTPDENGILQMLREKHPDCRNIIAYMPTHRNFGQQQPDYISDHEFNMINEFCARRDLLFLFKPHFHELKYYSGIGNHYSHIEIADIDCQPKFQDLYSYLGGVDLLVCDYSSLIFDFVYMDKPVVLFPYDLEKYNEKNGVPEDYFADPCGPICYNWNEVLQAIEAICSDDVWAEARERKKKLTHFYDDDQNCERIYGKATELRKGWSYQWPKKVQTKQAEAEKH